jgi:hypothetical protein
MQNEEKIELRRIIKRLTNLKENEKITLIRVLGALKMKGHHEIIMNAGGVFYTLHGNLRDGNAVIAYYETLGWIMRVDDLDGQTDEFQFWLLNKLK